MLIAATSGWTIVGAVGAAVGGLGAAAGALAAWRAASASRATGRDAMEALGLALAPVLSGEAGISPKDDGSETGTCEVRVMNISTQFNATKLHFEARFHDGFRVDDRLETLAAGSVWTVAMRVIGMPPGGPLPTEAGESATLRYSDERGIIRYEIQFGFFGRNNPDGSVVPSVTMGPVSEPVRIAFNT
jgi:hypothetical protein